MKKTMTRERPTLLDLFCCGGCASDGYVQAGFEVVGVDIVPQRHYPYTFIQADALDFLDTADLSGFDAIHASPECKAYTNCNLSPKASYLKLIDAVRMRLAATGKPYVIENVMGAKRELRASLLLCGTMFDLPMQRHRLFESNIFLVPPAPCRHDIAHIAVYGHSVWDSWLTGTQRKDGRKRPDSVSIEVGRAAMGVSRKLPINDLAEALPPAYTHWIGQQLLDFLKIERREDIA